MVVAAFIFIAVLLAGVPVFIALAGSAFVYTHFVAGFPDFVILHRMAGGIDSFPLLAVPFFILAGNLMNSAGITNRIYDFAVALAGWTRGGLAHVNIIGSVIFAGMSGTAIADAAGLGTIEIRAMTEHGYSSLDEFRGAMNLSRCPDPAAFERANYIRILQSWRV